MQLIIVYCMRDKILIELNNCHFLILSSKQFQFLYGFEQVRSRGVCKIEIKKWSVDNDRVINKVTVIYTWIIKLILFWLIKERKFNEVKINWNDTKKMCLKDD